MSKSKFDFLRPLTEEEYSVSRRALTPEVRSPRSSAIRMALRSTVITASAP